MPQGGTTAGQSRPGNLTGHTGARDVETLVALGEGRLPGGGASSRGHRLRRGRTRSFQHASGCGHHQERRDHVGRPPVFALISVVSFPAALGAFLRGDAVTGITRLSRSLPRLGLRPIIMAGQNAISASQDACAEADHETLTALHAPIVRQLQTLERQQKILEHLDEWTLPVE